MPICLLHCSSVLGAPFNLFRLSEAHSVASPLLPLSFLPGSHLPAKSHHPTEALNLMTCSATLRVFDKLSWTLHVVECQFVKYPKCGTCLAAPNWGRWDRRNRRPAGYENAHPKSNSSKSHFCDSEGTKALHEGFWREGGRQPSELQPWVVSTHIVRMLRST